MRARRHTLTSTISNVQCSGAGSERIVQSADPSEVRNPAVKATDRDDFDAAEQKRLETERLHFAAVVSSSHDAILTKTMDGIITSWNAEAERLYGYTAAEAVGRSVMLIIPP